MSPTATATRATATRSRQPKGAPASTGGQFREEAKDADVISLGAVTAPADENMWTKHYESVEEKITTFMDELAAQVDDLNTDEGWQDYLDMVASTHRYSLNNMRLIRFQKPDATLVMSRTAWAALGRTMKAGERQLSILRPKQITVDKKDASGNPVIVDGKPVKTKITVGWTGCGVLDVSQTEGVPLPDDRMTLSEEPPEGFIEDLESAIKASGYSLSYGETGSPSRRGYTTFDGSKQVVVQPGMTAGSTARTLAHELGHIAAGHIERAAAENDYHTGDGGHRGEMEVEADSISYALLRANGMSPEVGRANAAYVFGWNTHADRTDEAVRRVADNVTKAVKLTLERNTFRNVYEPQPVPMDQRPAWSTRERAPRKKTTKKRTTTRKAAASK